MKCKIYCSDIITFLFFHITFITFPYFENYNLLKYGIIVVVALYLFPKYKIIFSKKYRLVDIALTLFLIVVLVTGYINRNSLEERNPFLAAIVFSSVVLEAFMLFQYFEKRNKMNRVIDIFSWLMLFYVLCTDLLMVVKPNLAVEMAEYYLIGNKFSVVFSHFTLICLFWFKNHKSEERMLLQSKIAILLMYLLSIFASLYVDCATGVVGCIILFFFWVVNNKIISFTMKPIIPIIILSVACFILLFSQTILNNTVVRFLVEDVLDRDMTLTSRTNIYLNVYKVFAGHIWSGYGYGSTHEVCTNMIGASNTQNGLLEILLQFGIWGVVTFMILIYFVYKQNKTCKMTFQRTAINALIYVYIVLAVVEITLNLQFFVVLALMSVCVKMDEKSDLNIRLCDMRGDT